MKRLSIALLVAVILAITVAEASAFEWCPWWAEMFGICF